MHIACQVSQKNINYNILKLIDISCVTRMSLQKNARTFFPTLQIIHIQLFLRGLRKDCHLHQGQQHFF